MLGGIGPWEVAIIVVILLVIFGAGKLPEVGKSLGKGIREFKKAVQDIEKGVSLDEEEKTGGENT